MSDFQQQHLKDARNAAEIAQDLYDDSLRASGEYAATALARANYQMNKAIYHMLEAQ